MKIIEDKIVIEFDREEIEYLANLAARASTNQAKELGFDGAWAINFYHQNMAKYAIKREPIKC